MAAFVQFPDPDWSNYYSSKKELSEDLGIPNPKVGWYSMLGDTLLIQSIPANLQGMSAHKYVAHCWNDRDPREDLIRVAQLPQN